MQLTTDWSKEITYTLLRSGAWESFMRSMRLDMRHNRHCCDQRLRKSHMSTIQSCPLTTRRGNDELSNPPARI